MSQANTYRLPEHLEARRASQRRQTGTQIAALIVAVVCLVAGGIVLGRMNVIRKQQQLLINPAEIKGLPPDVALLGKLGTFRALAIDWASIRADRLKEEGKHYEALDLRKTICRLQPRFPNVWDTAAWDMAYNISVMEYTPEGRWKWVNDGIKLLRDEGIPMNPRSATLYKKLAWIYWHKIAGYMDDEHKKYKRRLAVDMEKVLGPPPTELSVDDYFAWFRHISDAPKDVKALIASDPEVAELAGKLDGLGFEPVESPEVLLEFVARNIRPEITVRELVQRDELAAYESTLDDRRITVLTAPASLEARQRLLGALRSKVLRERLRLDPQKMMEMMETRYGPLDWRNALSHSLYWATLGSEMMQDYSRQYLADPANTVRLILNSISDLVVRGRATFVPDFDEPFKSHIEFSPDPRYIPYARQLHLDIAEDYFGDTPEFQQEGIMGTLFDSGFVTRMEDWRDTLVVAGGEKNMELAEEIHAWLREHNRDQNSGLIQERYIKTPEEMLNEKIKDSLSTFRQSHALIRGFIQQALKHYAVGNLEQADVAMTRAARSLKFWEADATNDPNDRRRMEPFPIIVRDEIISFMKMNDIDPLAKATLWNQRFDLETRQLCYDQLRPYFNDLCAAQQPPWDVDRAFPEPVGMDEFRTQELKYRDMGDRDFELGERFSR